MIYKQFCANYGRFQTAKWLVCEFFFIELFQVGYDSLNGFSYINLFRLENESLVYLCYILMTSITSEWLFVIFLHSLNVMWFFVIMNSRFHQWINIDCCFFWHFEKKNLGMCNRRMCTHKNEWHMWIAVNDGNFNASI